ncbi:hypothetical protein QQF64_021561 [Cirrhinus molitorella]|uniref:Alkylated DNA repair protein AlkB homologue 8 N-terminal domain-containing protein n=1 Tax=Cirrhinus molitorella TaxID=172907 RepID=A0ABR3L5Y6_9TELE
MALNLCPTPVIEHNIRASVNQIVNPTVLQFSLIHSKDDNTRSDHLLSAAAPQWKGQSRLYLLRRLRSSGVQGALLRTFYDSVVASAILYGVVCWSSSITERERKKLDKVIKRSSFVLGCRLDSVREVGARRVLKKLTSMLDHDSHPLRDILLALESSFSRRLLHPQCVKERFRRSFLPAAVRLYNEHC